MLCYATISESSHRYETWIEVFGSDTVPLESGETVVGTVPGLAGPRRFYKLAYRELPAAVRSRALQHFAASTGEDAADLVNLFYGMHGVPILAEEVTVIYRGEFYF